MLNVVAVEDSQLNGAADAVVGAERRALGLHPFAVDNGQNGVVVEVVLHLGQLLAHHVHVTLQDDGGLLLHARRGRLTDDDIASLVNQRVQVVALAELTEILNHFLLALRWARDGVDSGKLLEDA